MGEYELYRERYLVTKWKDGAVLETEFVGAGWFDADEVDHPQRGVIYAGPSTNDPNAPVVSIRKKKTS